MTLTIGSDTALALQHYLQRSQRAMSGSVQRLSSGRRINSAVDDPAGLAVASRFSSQIHGINQAIRNSNDGISLVQLADGALREVTDMLQRVRELAVQAANASLSTSDRSALQKEVDEGISEVSRIIGETEYNGIGLFSEAVNISFQVGPWGREDNIITIETVDLTSSDGTAPTADAPLRQNPQTGGGKVYINLPDGTVEEVHNTTGLISDLKSDIEAATGIAAADQLLYFDGLLLDDSSYTSQYYIANKDNLYLEINDPSEAVLATYDDGTSLNISTQAAARNAIAQVDDDLETILDLRATYGGAYSRLESAARSLLYGGEALMASRSRIMDVDFASEMASLARTRIAQQAGMAMLTQANLSSQGVLSLLEKPAALAGGLIGAAGAEGP